MWLSSLLILETFLFGGIVLLPLHQLIFYRCLIISRLPDRNRARFEGYGLARRNRSRHYLFIFSFVRFGASRTFEREKRRKAVIRKKRLSAAVLCFVSSTRRCKICITEWRGPSAFSRQPIEPVSESFPLAMLFLKRNFGRSYGAARWKYFCSAFDVSIFGIAPADSFRSCDHSAIFIFVGYKCSNR